MKVVIAIDSFKGSASSLELSESIKEGLKELDKNIKVSICPMADGGEGTLEALSFAQKTETIGLTCKDPLGKDVKAKYSIIENNLAIIEMASASGLPLVPKDKRDPLSTSTYGTGELIRDALKRGVKEFVVGIGGSATNDAGLGMLRALGFRFFDAQAAEIIYAKELSQIASIDESAVLDELHDAHFSIACDVNNPLCGKNGASYVYGPQKGADEKMVIFLDGQLEKFSALVALWRGQDFSNTPGAGAAGGLGFAFLAFLNGELKSGIDIVLQKSSFYKEIEDADLVITGEGRIDTQSFMGKVCDGVGQACKKRDIPCIALAGDVKEAGSDMYKKGVLAAFSIMDAPMSLEEAMNKENTLALVKKKVQGLFRLLEATR